VGSATIPTVPMYGGDDEEFSLQQRQQSYLPLQGGWPRSAPLGLRPIGMQQPTFNLFGGNLFGGGGGPSMRNTPAGYSRYFGSAAAIVFVPDGYERRQVTPLNRWRSGQGMTARLVQSISPVVSKYSGEPGVAALKSGQLDKGDPIP
jgi:hypothetical protein